MINHINERGNPFDSSVTVTRNIFSAGKLDNELVAFKADCLVLQEGEQQKFENERL